jgi:signal transduction histidine kinase
MVLCGGLLLAAAVWDALRANQQAFLRASSRLQGESIRNEVQSRLDARVEALRAIARNYPGLGQSIQRSFDTQAQMLSGPFSGFRAIGVLDWRGRICRGISRSGWPHFADFDVRAYGALEPAWAKSRDSRQVQASRLVDLGDAVSFLVFVPVYAGDRFLGHVVGVFSTDDFFAHILPPSAELYSFKLYDQHREAFHRGELNTPQEARLALDIPFEIYGASWKLRIWPTPKGVAAMATSLPECIAVMGSLLSVLLAYAIKLLRTSNERAERLRCEVRDRKRAQAGLKRLNDDLERIVAERTQSVEKVAAELARSNADLEQFAFIASHDLKEPLRMVRSYVQLLERRYADKLDPEAHEFIDFACSGARRMGQLIDALLRYSRIGREPTPIGRVDCNEVVDGILGNLASPIHERGTIIHREELPAVDSDPSQIGQLFQNLIGNAIKFNDNPKPEVWIGAEPDGPFWRFHVRDNGIGIANRDAERIFVIFQRLHRDDRYPGTGIGLSICKKIVERHHGRIWVESEPGRGSTFYFTLPQRAGDVSAPGNEAGFPGAMVAR